MLLSIRSSRIFQAGETGNALLMKDNIWNGNSFNYATSIINNRNPIVDLGPLSGGTIKDNVFEEGPNDLTWASTNHSNLQVTGNNFADSVPCAPWVDSLAYTAGKCVIPSFTTTGNTHTNTTLDTLGSIANLFPGQIVIIKGAGAGGADYTGTITTCAAVNGQCTGSTATLSAATSATLTGANVYWGDYENSIGGVGLHEFMNTVGGTSGGSQPSWVTTPAGTTSDNGMTWTEFGYGASINAGGAANHIAGNTIGDGAAGIVLDINASQTPEANAIIGNFFGAAAGGGVVCAGCRQLSMLGNYILSGGWLLSVTTGDNTGNHAFGILYQGNYAAVQPSNDAVSWDASQTGGVALGAHNVAGNANSKWFWLSDTGALVLPVAGFTGPGDAVINAAQGGHISSQLGSGVLPTVSTGTVVAGGTDNAMRVTGATSPATVSFTTNFAKAPVCTCSDETAALGACKTSSPAVGSVVVTTTGTDSFDLICIGK